MPDADVRALLWRSLERSVSGYCDLDPVARPYLEDRRFSILGDELDPELRPSMIPFDPDNLTDLPPIPAHDGPSGHVTPRRIEPSHADQYEAELAGTVEGQTARTDGEEEGS